MKEEKLGQESAFGALMLDKNIKLDDQTTEHYVIGDNGMSKRFYAACAAMQGVLASYTGMQIKEFPTQWIAEESYKIADELLKQENQ